MRYSSRFWLYAPVTLFAALAAATMIHWWMLAGAFEKKLDALKGHAAIPGITIDWDTSKVGGFPFRVDAVFTGLRVAGAGAHGPFAWRSERFALHSLTYGATKDVFEAAGQQQLRWTDAGGREHAVQFVPGSLHASAILNKAGLASFDLDMRDAGSPDFTAGRFQFHMRRDPDGRDLDLMLKIESLTGIGADRKQVQVYATLTKADALTALLRGEKAWPAAAQAWREQGGAAKLTQIVAPDLSPDALLSPLY